MPVTLRSNLAHALVGGCQSKDLAAECSKQRFANSSRKTSDLLKARFPIDGLYLQQLLLHNIANPPATTSLEYGLLSCIFVVLDGLCTLQSLGKKGTFKLLLVEKNMITIRVFFFNLVGHRKYGNENSWQCLWRSSGELSGLFLPQNPHFHVWCPPIVPNCSCECSFELCHFKSFWLLTHELLCKYPLARNQYMNNSQGFFSCNRAGGVRIQARVRIRTEVNSPKILANYSESDFSKLLSCIRTSKYRPHM